MGDCTSGGSVVASRRRSLVSSSSLSCRHLLFARFATCWNENGGSNSKSCIWRTREQATKVSPEENSFLPMSTTALSSVRPWDLWILTAQASLRGSCSRVHWAPEVDHERRMGVMGTVPSGRVGPEYVTKCTITATGRSGGAFPLR